MVPPDDSDYDAMARGTKNIASRLPVDYTVTGTIQIHGRKRERTSITIAARSATEADGIARRQFGMKNVHVRRS